MSAKQRLKENMRIVIDAFTATIPEDIGPNQRLDMQMCFCAGVSAHLGFMLSNVEDMEALDTPLTLIQILTELQKELVEKKDAPKIQLIT